MRGPQNLLPRLIDGISQCRGIVQRQYCKNDVDMYNAQHIYFLRCVSGLRLTAMDTRQHGANRFTRGMATGVPKPISTFRQQDDTCVTVHERDIATFPICMLRCIVAHTALKSFAELRLNNLPWGMCPLAIALAISREKMYVCT